MLRTALTAAGTLARHGGHSLHRVRAEVTDGEEARRLVSMAQPPRPSPAQASPRRSFGECGIGQDADRGQAGLEDGTVADACDHSAAKNRVRLGGDVHAEMTNGVNPARIGPIPKRKSRCGGQAEVKSWVTAPAPKVRNTVKPIRSGDESWTSSARNVAVNATKSPLTAKLVNAPLMESYECALRPEAGTFRR